MEGGTTFFISLELDVPSQFQGIERSMKSWQRKFCAILALDSTFFASSSKRRFALNNDDRGEWLIPMPLPC